MTDIIARKITQIKVTPSEINSSRYQELYFYCDDLILKISIDPDTDELIMEQESSTGEIYSSMISPAWEARLKGKTIVSYWTTQNHKGYSDMFIIGVEYFEPSIIIYCLAGEIVVYNV